MNWELNAWKSVQWAWRPLRFWPCPGRLWAMDITSLQPAPYNPRSISDAALAGLKKSMHLFGDISGFTWNKRTGHLVAGHQRLRALVDQHGDGLTLETEEVDGVTEPAYVVAPGGESFPIRVVDWDEPTEKMANVAANAGTIQGEFTDTLPALLDELREMPAYDDLMFEQLRDGLEGPPEPPDSFGEVDDTLSTEHRCPKCGYEWSGSSG